MISFSVIKKITFKDILGGVYTFFSFFVAMALKKYIGQVSIVTERANEARDNGYWLFKYAVENKNDDHIYYAICKKAKDYEKVRSISENIIEFGSFKHCVYTWLSSRYISSQYSSGMPNRIMYYLWMRGICKTKFCFLQHGVTQNKSEYLSKPATRVKYIACVSKVEAKFMESLGYDRKNIFVNGFCRYDALVKRMQKNEQILIMFTWRKYLEQCSEKEFLNSVYYREFMRLLESLGNDDTFEKYSFLVCLHPGVEKYRKLFKMSKVNLNLLSMDDIEFDKLVSESAMLITDYSSLAFDFAYLEKPVIYFQFDLKEFREKHLQEGYFDYIEDGFGPVCSDIQEIKDALKNELNDNRNPYAKRASSFFFYRDCGNCARNYRQIMKV